MKKQNFQVYLMKHDEASRELDRRLDGIERIVVDVKTERCPTRKQTLTEIQNSFKEKLNGKTPIFVYGSGNYHHYTYGLCKMLSDKEDRPYTYIHIDRHKDYYSPLEDGLAEFHCGSFVKAILEDTNVKGVLTIGTALREPESKIIIGNEEKYIINFSSVNFSDPLNLPFLKIRKLLKNCESEVYVSVDMDALRGRHIKTDHGNGDLTLAELLKIIEIIKSKKRIFGADICGLSAHYDRITNSGIESYQYVIRELTAN
jgi:arginase family enzyme